MMQPPATVETFEFSYSRRTGKMRWRLNGHEWLTEKEVGDGKIVYADPKTGNLLIRGRLMIQGDTAYLYPPKEDEA